MQTVKVDKSGVIILPDDVRDALGVRGGGQLDLQMGSGSAGATIVLRPISDKQAEA